MMNQANLANHQTLPDDWQRWLAENIMLGAHPQGLLDALIKNGFDAALAAAEIQRALQSPYIQGAARLKARLGKRDWVLDIYRKLLSSR
jgi:hypothetical protein